MPHHSKSLNYIYVCLLVRYTAWCPSAVGSRVPLLFPVKGGDFLARFDEKVVTDGWPHIPSFSGFLGVIGMMHHHASRLYLRSPGVPRPVCITAGLFVYQGAMPFFGTTHRSQVGLFASGLGVRSLRLDDSWGKRCVQSMLWKQERQDQDQHRESTVRTEWNRTLIHLVTST
ncbi:hypothetical protein BDZ89DRAFT_473891 [Hymenopellis radicata]|nr:hypothetical protein BDZ89DRAFT_473891 [Hymenopellis radicata]